LEKKVEEAQMRALTQSSASLAEDVRDVSGIKVVTQRVDPADPKIFRDLADKLRDRLQSAVIGLAGEKDGKALILVAATKDLVARGFKAGELVKEMAAEVGGSGGGKPDMAQAGGTDPSKIPAALSKLYELVRAAGARANP
jgi:alanyl-tRNA synthetase